MRPILIWHYLVGLKLSLPTLFPTTIHSFTILYPQCPSRHSLHMSDLFLPQNILEVMDTDTFITLMVMESWVYAHIQTHKNVHIKCVKLSYTKHKSTELEKVRNLLLDSKLQYLFFTLSLHRWKLYCLGPRSYLLN